MFEIEKGKPIPPEQRGVGGGYERKYPWRDMKPGDSIFIPCKNGDRRKQMHRCKSSARAALVRITQRNCDGGVRVWRIA